MTNMICDVVYINIQTPNMLVNCWISPTTHEELTKQHFQVSTHILFFVCADATPGSVPDVSRECPGRVPGVSRECPGSVPGVISNASSFATAFVTQSIPFMGGRGTCDWNPIISCFFKSLHAEQISSLSPFATAARRRSHPKNN